MAAAYKPYSTGTPLMSAYPRDEGTINAHTEIAAMKSLASQALS